MGIPDLPGAMIFSNRATAEDVHSSKGDLGSEVRGSSAPQGHSLASKNPEGPIRHDVANSVTRALLVIRP